MELLTWKGPSRMRSTASSGDHLAGHTTTANAAFTVTNVSSPRRTKQLVTSWIEFSRTQPRECDDDSSQPGRANRNICRSGTRWQ